MNAWSRESGFTLMELTVAMGLTVAALGIAMTAINGLSAMRETTEMLTDGNQSLRQTLNLITRDLIVAGREIPVGGIPIPNDGAVPPNAVVSVQLRKPSPAGPARFFPTDSSTLPAVFPADGAGLNILGTPTDLVTTMAVDTTSICGTGRLDSMDLTDIAADGSSATVDPAMTIDCPQGTVPGVAAGVTAGDLIMFKNSHGVAMQMVTAVVGRTMQFAGNDPMGLNQRGAAKGTILQLRDPVTGTFFQPPPPPPAPPAIVPTQAFRVLMVSYYIDQTPGLRPQLMRRVNLQADTAIGIGIDNLQITYDFATDLINLINQPMPPLVIIPPDPVPKQISANQIRKANLFVSGLSRRPSTRTRQSMRTSMSTQVSLRNLSFVDRYNP